jgi:hypothetical protein
MTLDEMFDEMDLYGFDDFEDSQKLLLLNEAYFDIVTREPWPFLEARVSFTVPSGVSKLTNGASFRVVNATSVLNNAATSGYTEYNLNSVLSLIDTTNELTLTPERTDVIEKNYWNTDSSNTPQFYYFVDDDLYLFPQTNSTIDYRLFFTKTPVAASTDSSVFMIPARHHSVIVYGALVKAFLVNDDPQAAAFQNAFESRYQQMRADVWMQQYDRTERIHVMTDSYDWGY